MLSGLRRNLVLDAIDEVSQIAFLPDVGISLAKAAEKFGYCALGINGLPPADPGADPLILTETAPEGFRGTYVEERFYLVDHICAHARGSRDPFRFRDAPYDPAEGKGHQRFLEGLGSFGMSDGLIVPIGSPSGMPACVWLAGTAPDLCEDSVFAVQLIALCAAGRAQALSTRKPPAAARLTSREREVVRWISAGKTSWEIGIILGLSERAINKITAESLIKLQAVTRAQAVINALRFGEIEL